MKATKNFRCLKSLKEKHNETTLVILRVDHKLKIASIQQSSVLPMHNILKVFISTVLYVFPNFS